MDLAQAKQPLAEAKQPLATAKQPLAEAKQPLATAKQPLAEAKQPLAEAKQPLAEAKQHLTPNMCKILTDIVNGELYLGDSNALSAEEKADRSTVFGVLHKMFVDAGYCAAYQYMVYGYPFLGCSNPSCKLRHEQFT